MLPAINRLKKDADFERVVRGGNRTKIGPILVCVAPKTFEQPRFGFVVSKKVSKSAVIRNRFKRLIREQIRLSLNKIKLDKDAVVILLYNTDEKQVVEAVNKQVSKWIA